MPNEKKLTWREWGRRWTAANYVIVGAILVFLFFEALRQAQ
jgi:hypothetical protein